MDTARCRAVVASVKAGSFSKAAEELNYTASAVSQLVTAMEEDLGVVLFHRSRKGVRLTADGEQLYPVIYNFMRQEDMLYETAANIRGLLTGQIVIAAYPSICSMWLPKIIGRFQKDHPGVTIRTDDSIRAHVLDALKSGRADIGFFGDQHDFTGEWTFLERNPMVAVVGKNSPYANLDAFPLTECASAPLIQPSYGKDMDLLTIFERHGITPNITYVTRYSFTGAAMAENNMGVLLVNELSTRMWNYDVKVLPLDPPQYVSLGMAVSAVSSVSPAVREFAKYVREEFSSKQDTEKKHDQI